jgi:anti-sigma factor RsiW
VGTLQHRKLRRAIESYLDGEADPALAAEIRRHLAECWTCSEDAELLRLVKVALHQLDARRPIDLAAARLSRYAASLRKR